MPRVNRTIPVSVRIGIQISGIPKLSCQMIKNGSRVRTTSCIRKPICCRIAASGESGFVLFDWGAKTTGGYRSDLTRVLLTSKIPPKLEAIYGVVLNAQRQGIKAIRPGATLKSVDRAARRVIENAGYGKFFGHGLGHGIGLDIHEEPRFSPVAEGVLEPGMVITVEPGIYLPGWGGVRIEDDVLVTRDGHEVLTSVPKRFEDAVVQIA